MGIRKWKGHQFCVSRDMIYKGGNSERSGMGGALLNRCSVGAQSCKVSKANSISSRCRGMKMVRMWGIKLGGWQGLVVLRGEFGGNVGRLQSIQDLLQPALLSRPHGHDLLFTAANKSRLEFG